ncbi:hypothetical protein BFP70_03595 [Thioclava sp. SK-1]|uniref:DUF4396 domain-containing protein n=1 Tax=Thioclava sp. SK-1 TaxID=1889770 RepID=UPI000824B3D9|nr:DUF4396 domain-containing protein [Thioclava sp. SK-1]OCX66922.1 hypothetical protein BFP70_03595 [Thioclava sp. SK-1]
MVPEWFTGLAWVSLAAGLICAALLILDLRKNPPHMAIMAWVWPIAALFGHVLVLWFYFRHGRMAGHMHGDEHHHMPQSSMPVAVAKGALHCGAGCTLGDILAECLVLLAPAVLIPFGWPDYWGDRIFAIWGLDFILALGIGVVFQYFAIAPMRGLGVAQGLKTAFKADVASLTAWQIGMYGIMALFHFGLFKHMWNTELTATTPQFWFAMQIAMMAGFVTAYPVNWLLISRGIKERM